MATHEKIQAEINNAYKNASAATQQTVKDLYPEKIDKKARRIIFLTFLNPMLESIIKKHNLS